MNDAQVVKDLTLQTAELVTGADGVQYSRTQLFPVVYDPQPKALEIQTLSGLVEYVKNNKDEMKENDCFAIVDHARSVRIMGGLTKTMSRKTLVHAVITRQQEFQFGSWIEHEEFVIRLASLFVPNGPLGELTKFLSKVSADEGVTTEDDGITQRATLKSGLSGALKEGKQVPLRVKLQPFRTFPEIDQPASEFLFRMRKSHSGGVACALFACDGEMWEKDCVVDIAAWLKKNLIADVKVIC